MQPRSSSIPSEKLDFPRRSDKFRGEGLTYDDVLLVPRESSVMPREVSTRTRITKSIELNIPVVSAAMDTVTESELAIALAREGGVGVLHKNMSIEQQAAEVRRVKRSESGMIRDPITLSETDTVAAARAQMARFSIGGIPIVDSDTVLIGIVTNRDLRFQTDGGAKLGEIMTRGPLVTAPLGTTLEAAEALLQEYKIEKLPVVDDSGQLKGLITFKDIQKKRQFPYACKDEHGRLRVGAAVGVTEDLLDRISLLVDAGVDFVTVDTAHGHSRAVLETVQRVKTTMPELSVVAGNVATREGTRDLIDAGADAVKVGIGPGSICTTRIVAGVGVPQLSAVLECADEGRKHGIPIVADGGIRHTGDIPKALAAGAHCIMIGGLFARVEESPGETILLEGRKYKSYRGMGSVGAMESGSKDRYFQDAEDDIKKLVPEGIEGRVPYGGTLHEVVYQMMGGLRSAMGYCGAANVEDLFEHGQFVRITASGHQESHPHDIFITREAPNYSSRS
ncbi:MAG: IMP dehydrogenase [Rhodothermia bacterium]|nr:MAG: IMP dehydrogenase [Rhodothermia bacterium]